MLRNEKQCTLHYRSRTFTYIHTGSELIGEDDGDLSIRKILKKETDDCLFYKKMS